MIVDGPFEAAAHGPAGARAGTGAGGGEVGEVDIDAGNLGVALERADGDAGRGEGQQTTEV